MWRRLPLALLRHCSVISAKPRETTQDYGHQESSEEVAVGVWGRRRGLMVVLSLLEHGALSLGVLGVDSFSLHTETS